MEGINSLPACLVFLLVQIVILVPLFLIFLVQLPFQLVRRCVERKGRARRSASRLHVTTNEPLRGDATGVSSPARDTVVLIHGFPDAPRIWAATVRRLTAAGYRCLAVALPGCRGQAVGSLLSPDDIVAQLNDALSNCGSSSVTVIAHDWGAIFTRLLQRKHPNLVHRCVLLDVGDCERLGVLPSIICFSYQLTLMLIYYIGNPVGSAILRQLICRWRYKTRPISELNAAMAWPYPAYWKWIVTAKLTTGMSWEQDAAAPPESVQAVIQATPTMYLYGKHKPISLHTDAFLDFVRATPHGVAEGWKAGHWLQLDREPEWLSTLMRWMEASRSFIQKGGKG